LGKGEVMEIKIEFQTIKDLQVKLTALLEDLEPNNQTSFDFDEQSIMKEVAELPQLEIVKPSDLVFPTLTATSIDQILPTLRPAEPVEVAPVVEPVEEVKPKATRKKKEPSFVIQEPAPPAPAVESPKVNLDAEPKNFYSVSEFTRSFPKIMTALLGNQSIDHTYLGNKCKAFGVTFIYALSTDTNKLTELYNQMVLEGIITQKGDY
jgi:hypothetical protein